MNGTTSHFRIKDVEIFSNEKGNEVMEEKGHHHYDKKCVYHFGSKGNNKTNKNVEKDGLSNHKLFRILYLQIEEILFVFYRYMYIHIVISGKCFTQISDNDKVGLQFSWTN